MSKFTLEAANFTQISGKKDLNFGLHSPLLWKVQYFITSPPMMLSWRGGSRISHSGAGSANLLGRDTNSRGGYLLETIELDPWGGGRMLGVPPGSANELMKETRTHFSRTGVFFGLFGMHANEHMLSCFVHRVSSLSSLVSVSLIDIGSFVYTHAAIISSTVVVYSISMVSLYIEG